MLNVCRNKALTNHFIQSQKTPYILKGFKFSVFSNDIYLVPTFRGVIFCINYANYAPEFSSCV